jgi:hypothetical protein
VAHIKALVQQEVRLVCLPRRAAPLHHCRCLVSHAPHRRLTAGFKCAPAATAWREQAREEVWSGWDPAVRARARLRLQPPSAEQLRLPVYFYPSEHAMAGRIERCVG